MTATLDFIIGGMPRGGTTAAGNLFNVHPDSFCYAAETHWLPLLMEFAETAPVPRNALRDIERITLAQNRQVLFEMARFSVKRGAHPRVLIFEEADLQPLTSALVALMRKGLYGEKLLAASLPILRAHIVERTGKKVVGEKTPNNLFAFERFGALGTKAALMMVREPYAVVRSMQNRGKNEEDIYAAPFRAELIGLIGIWLSHVEAILKARRHPSTVLLNYEEMMKSPIELIGDLYRMVGLDTPDSVLQNAAKHFREMTKGTPWSGMSPSERALVWHLTRSIREAVGYGDAFYDGIGFDRNNLADDGDLSNEQFIPVYGIYPQTPGEGGVWLMRSGCLALQSKPGRRKVRLKLWQKYPVEILPKGSTATMTFRTYDSAERTLATAEATGDHSDLTEVEIDLADLPPAMANKSGEMRLVGFEASHAYRGYLIPRPGLVNLVLKYARRAMYGGDRRQMSFALLGVEYT